MLSKIMAGGMVAALAALAIVFGMLMAAKTANGKLAADVDRVVAANSRQQQVITVLQDKSAELIARVDRERDNALKANEALLLSEQDREQAEIDFQVRLVSAVSELTAEERECANEMVPSALIDSLTSGLRN